ncbi:intermediate filament tail domain protein [Necator americanus]|uniref:Intermediate filament tail domain protein n=1 Tax=Necator americanus TaxID=51031 RepID=W2TGX4_NECAM|nr:intermediate filament tail domain protein [Necator americanus]ETN80252.1 intermediate filament tail domain protein [Necator americanus]
MIRNDVEYRTGGSHIESHSETVISSGEAKLRYDAEAEKIPSLNIELNNTRSRYESALRGRDLAAEDSLLVRLCDVRSQICLAKGRGKVIQEECQRLRNENQKLIDDIASQRQIFDRETQERYSYERRARPLLQECEDLLRKCKMETATIPGYSFDDIEKDRKHFREGIAASMGDIRRQYDILASTVNSEMEQWYKEQVVGIDIKQREDASSYKKKLEDLRAELVAVRTQLAHLEERVSNLVCHFVDLIALTSLIGDFEDAREQEQKISDSCMQEEETNIKRLIERYNDLLSAPTARDEKYSVATLRVEILRYRELLDSVGPRSNRDISSILRSAFEKMDSRVGVRRTSTHESTGIGSGAVQIGGGTTYGGGGLTQTYSATKTTYTYSSGTSQIGSGVTSQAHVVGGATIGSGATSHGGSVGYGGATSHTHIGGGATSQTYGGGSSSHTHIGGGATSHTYQERATSQGQIGTGATSDSRSETGAVVMPHIGQGVAAQDITSDGSAWSSKQYTWTDRKQPTVVSTIDYTIRDERDSAQRSGADHEYTMQRSAQGNVSISKVAHDGSYVIIENTSMDIDQHIGEWTLRSTSSSLKQVSYTFPRGFTLAPQTTVQVFARGKGEHNPPHTVVCEADSTFATGDDLDIYLYDNNGQERARLNQRSFFRSGATLSTF